MAEALWRTDRDGWDLEIQSGADGHHMLSVSLNGHHLNTWNLDKFETGGLRIALGVNPQIEGMATLAVPSDGVKMLRETLCVAQSLINTWPSPSERRQEHSERLGFLINECDRHRPTGPDGKHGDRHTETCGCEDK